MNLKQCIVTVSEFYFNFNNPKYSVCKYHVYFVHFMLHMCVQFSSSTVNIQDKLSMAITLQTYINRKLQAIQEQLDDIHKMDNTSNIPCRKIVEEFGISVSTRNNGYTTLRHHSQTVCKNTWVRNKMKRAEHGKVKQILMEWYGMAKTGSSMTCACKKKRSCLQ